MVVSFGYLILRQLLQLIVLGMRGEGSNEAEILVLRHQIGAASSGQTPGSGTDRPGGALCPGPAATPAAVGHVPGNAGHTAALAP